MGSRGRGEPVLGAALALILVSIGGIAAAGIDVGRMGLLQGLLGVAGVAWLLAVHRAQRVADSRGVRVLVVGGAVALRLAALGTGVGLSDDVYRYVWEGGLVARGESPYAFAPDAPERRAERAAWPEVAARLNNPDVSAAYPPGTQLLCAGVVSLAGGPANLARAVLLLRVTFALLDLLVLWPLLGLLARLGRPAACAVVWAWSPLVALEFAGAAHFDSAGVLCLVAALWVLAGRAPRHVHGGAVLLGLGASIKLLPAVLLPFALRPLRRRWPAILSFAALPLAGLLLVLSLRGGSLGLGRGLSEYALRWESFNLAYRWIERPLALWLERDASLLDPRRVGRALVLLAFLALALRSWVRRQGLVRASAALTGGFLVLTPTLHPWYLAWLVPLLALVPSRAFLVLTAAAPLLYWPLEGWRSAAVWHEPAWLWPLVAGSFWALLAGELVCERAAGRDGPPPFP